MENFNKNWLVILLAAVIFGTLGFLVGRTTGPGGHKAEHMMWVQDEDGHNTFDLKVDVEAGDELVKIDTIMKDGKQIIIKEVKKVKK